MFRYAQDPPPDTGENLVRARVVIGLALLVTFLVAPVARAADDVGLITGGEKGTYYQFGLDLQRLMKSNGFNMTVHPSRGSVDNVYAVYQRPGVQLGIVQSDVLAFVSRVESDPLLRRIAKKTKMVFPLYNEEVHLVGRRDIASFDDLAGKRVAIGREGSGTYLTARLLFKLSDVVPAEMVSIDTGEAVSALRAGRVDAMFYVAGSPVKLFKDDVSAEDRLALIPITHKSVVEFYPSVTIPGDVYAWQSTPVPTVAVKAVLVSFDFRRRECDTVGRFAQVMASKMSWLTANGHPKWKAVDLDYPLKGWEQYDCVRRAMGRAPVPAAARGRGSDNPISDAIKTILGD
jgi:TRAP transporter TAXI family solute receptor